MGAEHAVGRAPTGAPTSGGAPRTPSAGAAAWPRIDAGGTSVSNLGAAPPGADRWVRLGARTLAITAGAPAAGAIRDDDGTLTRWLRSKKAAAVVLRPDGFVFAAAAQGGPLPVPPKGLTDLTPPIAATPIGVTA